MSGHLFAIDGPDGCGKTTVMDILRGEMNPSPVFIRMPGGTPFGEKIRAALKDPAYKVCRIAERLAFSADSAQTLDEVVIPSLDRGDTVISDRWTPFTDYAYGMSRGVSMEDIANIQINLPVVRPSVLFILLPPFDAIMARKEAMDDMPGTPKCRIESLGKSFARKVYDFYDAAINTQDSKPWHLAHARAKAVVGVRGNKTAREVTLEILETITGVMNVARL